MAGNWPLWKHKGLSVELTLGGAVQVHAGTGCEAISPSMARQLAAVLVSLADEADGGTR